MTLEIRFESGRKNYYDYHLDLGLRDFLSVTVPGITLKISLIVRKHTFEHFLPAMIQVSLRIRTIWSESSLGAFWVAKDAIFLHADNEDSDQTARSAGWFESSFHAHIRRYVFSCHVYSFQASDYPDLRSLDLKSQSDLIVFCRKNKLKTMPFRHAMHVRNSCKQISSYYPYACTRWCIMGTHSSRKRGVSHNRFHIFPRKHMSWVLIRSASVRRF